MSLDKDCCLETFSEAFREGKNKEQERIIKLLEKNAKGEYKKLMITPKLIALIKGARK